VFSKILKCVLDIFKVIACTDFQLPTSSRAGDIKVFCTNCHAHLWAHIPKILKHFLDIVLRWLHVPTFKVLPLSVLQILRFLYKTALTATPTCGRNFQKSWNTSSIFFKGDNSSGKHNYNTRQSLAGRSPNNISISPPYRNPGATSTLERIEGNPDYDPPRQKT